MDIKKAKRLMDIMYEEDEIRYNNNEELMYHTKEDFEKKKKERENT